jgi:hypothetical protein
MNWLVAAWCSSQSLVEWRGEAVRTEIGLACAS